MANSYGVTMVPDDANYGAYDTENGEWTGNWYADREAAQEAANELGNDEHTAIVSTRDDDDWVEPE